MTENIVNQITLDCLINREIFDKHNSTIKNMKINKKDKKFYRKRILNLTRELLLTKKEGNDTSDITNIMETTVTPDLLYAFNNYVKACIQNFKTIDKNDIIQEDYKDMNLSNQNILNSAQTLQHDHNIQETSNDNNRLFMRTVKTKPSLDNFVKYTYKKQHDDIILPKIREINLDEPNLRNKGIKKKEKENNINIVYDENKKK